MIPTYASSRLKLPSSSFAVETISGSTTIAVANTYNVSIQAENRAGLNLLSDSKAIAITTGEGIQVTFNANAIATGEDIFYLVVSLQTTGIESDAVQVASWKTKDIVQTNLNSLPDSIQLTTDEHFNLTRTAADFASLPASGLASGAIAQTLNDSLYWRYDNTGYNSPEGFLSYGALAEGSGSWARHYRTNSAYIENIREGNGCDRPLIAVENALPVPPKISDSDTLPIKYYLNNYEQSPVIGGRFTFLVTINGQEYQNVFAEKIKYKLLGYVDRATGVLDTNIDTVGDTQVWSPTIVADLPADLPSNHAALYEVWLSYTVAEMLGKIPKEIVDFRLSIVPANQTQGRLSEAANLNGDFAYPDGGKLLIVPGETRLTGIGTIKMPGDFGFYINPKISQPIIGLLPNTADQVAAISGSLNGFVTIRQQNDQLEYSEIIRAIIGTESGISQIVASNTVSLTNEAITITITHPVNNDGLGIVRADYIDPYLAGNEQGTFTPSELYLAIVIDGTIYEFPSQVVGTQQTQDITIISTTGATTVGSLPVQSNPAFSLFDPVSAAIASDGAGSLTGSVQVYVGYNYPTNNTKATVIRHDLPTVMPTSEFSIGEILGQLSGFAAHIVNNSNPHGVTAAQVGAPTMAQLATTDQNVSANATGIQGNADNISNLNDFVNDQTTKGTVTTTNKTLTNADYHNIINFDNSSDLFLDLAISNLSTPDGFEFIARKINTGNINLTVPNGITLSGSGTIISQVFDAVYFRFENNNWTAIGNLTN